MYLCNKLQKTNTHESIAILNEKKRKTLENPIYYYNQKYQVLRNQLNKMKDIYEN